MKTKNNETKYYWTSCGKNTKEIPLNRENWWFVQLDATIRCTFGKYDLPMPKAVLFDRAHEGTNSVPITVVRENLDGVKDVSEWFWKWFFVKDELDIQARANSTDDVTYKFHII